MTFPISLWRVLTIFSWGIDLHLPNTILTVVWRGGLRAHLSPDGTPNRATWSWARQIQTAQEGNNNE